MVYDVFIWLISNVSMFWVHVLFFKILFWQAVLGYELRQKGAPHNCINDATAAMKLVLAKIERGVDNDIPLKQEDVSYYR